MKMSFFGLLNWLAGQLSKNRALNLRRRIAKPILIELQSQYEDLRAQQLQLANSIQSINAGVLSALEHAKQEQLATGVLLWNQLQAAQEQRSRHADEMQAAGAVIFEKMQATQIFLFNNLHDLKASFDELSTSQSVSEQNQRLATEVVRQSNEVNLEQYEKLNKFLRDEFFNLAHGQKAIDVTQQAQASNIRSLIADFTLGQAGLMSVLELQQKSTLQRDKIFGAELRQTQVLGQQTQAILRAGHDAISAQVGIEAKKLQAVLLMQGRMQEQLSTAEEDGKKLKNLVQETRAALRLGQDALFAKFQAETAKLEVATGVAHERLGVRFQQQKEDGVKVNATLLARQDFLATQYRGEVEKIQVALQLAQENLLNRLQEQAGIAADAGENLRKLEDMQVALRTAQDALAARFKGEAEKLHVAVSATQDSINVQLRVQAEQNTKTEISLLASQAQVEITLRESLQTILGRYTDSNSIQTTTSDNIAALRGQIDTILQYSYASARRVAVPCGPNEVLLKTAVGYLLCASNDHALLACLVDTGELEQGTRKLIEKILKPGDVFIDVGANVGIHTLAAARAMHGRGKIIAYEPFASTTRLLEKSIWLNGYSQIVEVRQVAVSNKTGKRKLFLGVTSGHHSLFKLDELVAAPSNPVEVHLETLDQLIPNTPNVNLIKIDAEGAEIDVLNGARLLIAKCPEIALIVEFGPSHLRRTKQIAKTWFAEFKAAGLVYRAIDEYSGMLEERTVKQLEEVESANLLFARPKAKVWAVAGAPSI